MFKFTRVTIYAMFMMRMTTTVPLCFYYSVYVPYKRAKLNVPATSSTVHSIPAWLHFTTTDSHQRKMYALKIHTAGCQKRSQT